MQIETEKLKEYELNRELFDALPKTEYNALKEDIKKKGIKTELHILPDYTVLCGHQRLRIARELGLVSIPVKIVKGLETKEQIEEYIIIDNLLRRHLKPEQRAILLLKLDRIIENIGPGQPKKELRQNGVILNRWEVIAQKSGETPRTAQRLVQYAKEVEKRPELKGQKVTQVLRGIKKEKQLKTIKELKPITGKFHVIVMDPPWKFNEGYDPDSLRGEGDYPVMTLEEIRKIKLPATEDCILWLWGVDYFLEETLEIIESWGFERKSTLIWAKDKMGLGHWLRNQHEYCFLAVKGKPVFHGESTPSILHAVRRKHSEKPEEFYKMVEKTCPYKDKLDYFSRKKREGWISYGDEVEL